MAAPNANAQDAPTPLNLSRRTRRLFTGVAHGCCVVEVQSATERLSWNARVASNARGLAGARGTGRNQKT